MDKCEIHAAICINLLKDVPPFEDQHYFLLHLIYPHQNSEERKD